MGSFQLEQAINTLFIHGWKNIAKELGVSERTVKRWHYQRCAMPVSRFGGFGNRPTRVSMSRINLHIWLSVVRKDSNDKKGWQNPSGYFKNGTTVARE